MQFENHVLILRVSFQFLHFQTLTSTSCCWERRRQSFNESDVWCDVLNSENVYKLLLGCFCKSFHPSDLQPPSLFWNWKLLLGHWNTRIFCPILQDILFWHKCQNSKPRIEIWESSRQEKKCCCCSSSSILFHKIFRLERGISSSFSRFFSLSKESREDNVPLKIKAFLA